MPHGNMNTYSFIVVHPTILGLFPSSRNIKGINLIIDFITYILIHVHMKFFSLKKIISNLRNTYRIDPFTEEIYVLNISLIIEFFSELSGKRQVIRFLSKLNNS